MTLSPNVGPAKLLMDNAIANNLSIHRLKTPLRKNIYTRQDHLVHHVRNKSITFHHTQSQTNHPDIMIKETALASFRTASVTLIHPTFCTPDQGD